MDPAMKGGNGMKKKAVLFLTVFFCISSILAASFMIREARATEEVPVTVFEDTAFRYSLYTQSLGRERSYLSLRAENRTDPEEQPSSEAFRIDFSCDFFREPVLNGLSDLIVSGTHAFIAVIGQASAYIPDSDFLADAVLCCDLTKGTFSDYDLHIFDAEYLPYMNVSLYEENGIITEAVEDRLTGYMNLYFYSAGNGILTCVGNRTISLSDTEEISLIQEKIELSHQAPETSEEELQETGPEEEISVEIAEGSEEETSAETEDEQEADTAAENEEEPAEETLPENEETDLTEAESAADAAELYDEETTEPSDAGETEEEASDAASGNTEPVSEDTMEQGTEETVSESLYPEETGETEPSSEEESRADSVSAETVEEDLSEEVTGPETPDAEITGEPSDTPDDLFEDPADIVVSEEAESELSSGQ